MEGSKTNTKSENQEINEIQDGGKLFTGKLQKKNTIVSIHSNASIDSSSDHLSIVEDNGGILITSPVIRGTNKDILTSMDLI